VVRNPIQQLPPALINRIAAGEVIERPASVVKELIENAVDAGATEITVEVEDGGRELIRVIDNGCGIPPGELLLAFASHATSKLACDEDLFRIGTMGFRGEALASIGSVSHARIFSRTHEPNAIAWEVLNRGSTISAPQAAAGNVGTTIEIRNLFFNVPARRKFLKGTQTEYGYISEQLLRTALPMCEIAFKLFHNGRLSLDLPATTPERRWLAAWPSDFHEQRLPIDSGDAEIRLRGVIGLPELARPTAKYQHFFLNNRPIRDKFIQHALRESYRGLTEPGRHPAAILLVTIPPQDVDVNVHPTKAEVRFKDSGRIHGLVMSTVRERLLGSDLTPRAIPNARPQADDTQRNTMQQRLADFFRAPAPAVSQPLLPMPAGLSPVVMRQPPAPTAAFSLSTPAASGELTDAHVAEREAAPFAAPLSQTTPIQSPADAPLGDAFPVEPQPASPFAHLPTMSSGGKALQLHNSYLIAQTDDGLVIIDQHALHERVIFEELLTRIARGPLESQRLLIPITLSASSRQCELLEQIQPLLGKLGIEASVWGPGSVAVQGFPSFLHRLDPGEFIRELLEKGEQELLDLTEEQLLHEVLDMMSCKAAVKAGDPLSPDEISALLARRELVDRSSNCPHGRPTTLRLSLRDLEKQFKRTGF